MPIIRVAELHEISAIRLFYSRCDYGGGIEAGDQLFVAQANGEIVGAVRLCPGNDFIVLRGMQVLSTFQGRGIGTELLQTCAQKLADHVCYCLPWRHLHSFYNQAGFYTLSPAEAPDLMRERFDAYTDKGLNVLLMCRCPSFDGETGHSYTL
ncbi:hypothetical protein C1752_03892 [Acaryochloris thomasi RCC1774]|uniref:N-acetyltransferase domain-containing protein n=1 Tax=Acaryochloris thomasi RCC1774 TaxID=1764569 RepID=A0A2W1JLI0_9CYAN|nr:GNAT family N-acetyltransferase [Acaryochloris thomasi]PZD72305.1 hypothetical protein C1752_03892 [Acaryochloris thomasi RCC1774]